jgi:hypothetical protein
MRILLKKTSTNRRRNGPRITFIITWNFTDVFVRPNNIEEFKQPLLRAVGCLVDVVGGYPDLVVPRPKIQLDEERRPVQLVEKLFHNRNQELVLHGDTVEHAVVHAKPPGSVVLLDEQHRCCESR